MKALFDSFLNEIPVPREQIYSINEELLEGSTEQIAKECEKRVFSPYLDNKRLKEPNISLDCVLLGGPRWSYVQLIPRA